jgi:Uma2 family endonuclease
VDVEGWVATSPDDDRIPDICVYLADESSGMGVPDRIPAITFEFVSASRADQERDYIYKRAEYETVGIAEYVIVDRFKEQVLVLTLQDGEYAERVLSRTDCYTTPQLPELSVDLVEVFPADA